MLYLKNILRFLVRSEIKNIMKNLKLVVLVVTVMVLSVIGFRMVGAQTTSPTTLPTVTLLAPVGGEVWQQGQTYQITWKRTNFNDAVSIYLVDYTPGPQYNTKYSITNGSTTGSMPGQTSFSWTIPASVPAGNRYKMVVGEGLVNGFSGDYFTIIVSPAVTSSPTVPIDVPLAPTCNDLWWFNNETTSCSEAMFCGTYMYQGLRTFPTKSACEAALPNVGVAATTTPALSVSFSGPGVGSVTTTVTVNTGNNSSSTQEALQQELTQLIALLLQLLQKAAAQGLLSPNQLSSALGAVAH